MGGSSDSDTDNKVNKNNDNDVLLSETEDQEETTDGYGLEKVRTNDLWDAFVKRTATDPVPQVFNVCRHTLQPAI